MSEHTFKSAANDLRGILSDWLLDKALTVAPEKEKAELALVLSAYLRRRLEAEGDAALSVSRGKE